VPEAGFESALGAAYRLDEVVGRGATGEVWRAVDRRTDEIVAAKLLRREHVADRDLVARFIQERSVLTGLRHPSLVSVRDLVVEGDRLAIVMDYVGGGTLRDVLAQGPLAPGLAARLVAEVLDGLSAAHGRRLVHRDIKPDNVLLAPGWQRLEPGDVRLTDFGIARIVGEGPRTTTGLLGTPEYMSPELLTTGGADSPADVYGVGILLYELLAGRTPFAGPGTDYTVAHRHVSNEPPVLPVPRGLWSLIASLLEKNPRARPTAAETADALRRLAPTLAGVPALEPQVAPADFPTAAGPATVVRGLAAATDEAAPPVASPLPAEMPDLGAPGPATVVRPMPTPPPSPVARAVDEADERSASPWWRDRRWQAGIAATLVLVAIVALVMDRGIGGSKGGPDAGQAAQASQTDEALPTGLTISRSAELDPETRTVELTVTYAAQNAPLRGPFLEVLAGLKGSGCPAVTWKGGEETRNLPTVTGVDAPCAWSVDPGPIERQGKASVTATVGLSPDGSDSQSRLQDWLAGNAAATLQAVSDPELTSTSYAVQRLQGIDVVAPSETVSGKTLPLTLRPVWPKGPDALNPLYRSPSVGRPSGLLDAVAGGESGVRFSDACSGALSVSSDGLVVTALSFTPSCTVAASVGNFADLQSNEFAIVTRGG
jgi:tRNA A-37 threonylcarbamoyl transferase component Bud32